MKKQLMVYGLGLALVAGTSLALAQMSGEEGRKGQGGMRGDPQQRMQRMQQHLGLSDEQMSQMREIRENGGSREDMRGVLNDEQRAKIDQHRANREARGGGRRGGEGRPGRPDSEQTN
ncbi:MAG: hypothetical protein ABJ308_07400 [Halieaceae bacterium]